MDGITDKLSIGEYFRKYRIVILILLLGIALLILPESNQEQPQEKTLITEEKMDLERSLAHILGQIQGAGKVEVLLTESAGEQISYQTDEDHSGTEVRRNTVLIQGADRDETGLVRQILPPTYQGAIVVCQGADSAQIRLAVVEAVMCATGLRSDQISVLKMK